MLIVFITSFPVDIMNHKIPKEYIIISSKKISIILGIFLKYMTKDAAKNPIRNPPVGPSIIPIPPVKFEKTGSPIAPSTKYNNKTFQESFLKIREIKNIPNVCNVIGTPIGKGILIQENITNKEVKIAKYAVLFFIITSIYIQ